MRHLYFVGSHFQRRIQNIAISTCEHKTMFILLLLSVIHVAFGIDPKVTITNTDPATKINDLNRKEVVVLKNKDVSFTCVVINREPGKKVEWIGLDPSKPKEVVSIGTAQDAEDPFKYMLDQPSSMSWRLRIQNAQVNDEKKYVCQVSIGNQKFEQDERWLRVTEKPKIIDLQTSSDTTVSEGDPISLACNASGRPAPLIKWERLAGGVLPNGGREHRETLLDMGRATPLHRGHFKCSAENEMGKDERKIEVTVRFKPRVSSKVSMREQMIGYRQDLECIIVGYPVPSDTEISWTRNGKKLTSTGSYKIVNLESADSRKISKLKVLNVQYPDYGFYKCTATNNEGEGSAEIELKQSTIPMPDSTGLIHSGASLITISFTTLFMLLSVTLLHYFRF